VALHKRKWGLLPEHCGHRINCPCGSLHFPSLQISLGGSCRCVRFCGECQRPVDPTEKIHQLNQELRAACRWHKYCLGRNWLVLADVMSLSSLLLLPAGYDIFNMSCLRVILQVRGRDGMSTPQNDAAAYSQSHVSCICQGSFPLPSLQFSSSWVSSHRRSSLTAEAFLWPHCL